MSQSRAGIRFVAVPGSVRPDNYTSRALALVVAELRQQAGVAVDVFDPRELELAMPGQESQDPRVEELRTAVAAATGVILATPEYHGSYSSVIKLVIENLGFPSRLAGKPVSLLGVAAGQIGAVKALEHLRSVCSHVGAIVLPGGVSVANVQKLFDADGRCLDARTEARLRGIGTNLLEFVHTNICPRIALEAMAREA